nr:immunoglobulin light chain junction region [Macaca mulatta]MOW10070.1 immunoglobulin light chain junction region [Macaca mulatta]MOW10731.1 immunoglobulin light chain junction region [Macaca mulatta]MOW12222.1 immunoglobulin light chain junction region [Macaca mulatta]MOW12395.1 immunoglobulin light chain junction region [Macaca mulatta]
CMQGLESPFTF